MKRRGSPISSAWSAWSALWSGDGDPRPLACFRIGWGACALYFAWKDRPRALSFVDGRYHASLFGDAWVPNQSMAEALLAIAAGGALLVLLGVWARLGALLFVAAQGTLFTSDLLQFRNHEYLLLLTGAVLALAPTSAALSVATAFGRGRPASSYPRWPAQLLKGQFLVVYAWAALNKLNGAFLDGWVLEAELNHYFPKSFVGALLRGPLHALEPAVASMLSSARVLSALSWAAATIEIAIVVTLVWPRFRRYGVVLGAMLHLGIAATMNVFLFGVLMIASYALFLPPRRWQAKPERASTLSKVPSSCTLD
jgi:hypothetical protein